MPLCIEVGEGVARLSHKVDQGVDSLALRRTTRLYKEIQDVH